MRPLIISILTTLFRFISGIKKICLKFFHPIDFVLIPILSYLIVYLEEYSLDKDFVRLQRKIQLDIISEILIQPTYRFCIWCTTLIGYRHLLLDYMRTRDTVIRQETLNAFSRWVQNNRRVSWIPPAA